MSLLNNTTTTAPAAATTTTAGKPKHSNSEYQKKQRELLKQHGATILGFLSKQKDIPADVKEAADWLKGKVEGRAPGANRLTGKPAFYKIFGDAPKIGDKVTALQIFEASGKGFSEMRSLMKKWETKQGIKVEFDEKTKSYIIKSGDIKPYSAE